MGLTFLSLLPPSWILGSLVAWLVLINGIEKWESEMLPCLGLLRKSIADSNISTTLLLVLASHLGVKVRLMTGCLLLPSVREPKAKGAGGARFLEVSLFFERVLI